MNGLHMTKEKAKNPLSITVGSTENQKEYLKDLFRYRELFYFLAWRDIVVRYKQTILGVLWAVVRPLLTMAVFVLVFGKIAQLTPAGENYPLFVLAGVLPWTLFSNSLLETSNSLINNAHLISKIYFPRIILPMSNIMVHGADFLISLIVFFVLLLLTGNLFHWSIFLVPFFLLLVFLFCLGTSLWLAAITVRYRDFRFIVPFLVQFGVFISPVGYSSFLLNETFQWFYFLNPMAGIIEGFRWCCLESYHPLLFPAISISCVVNGLILITGFQFFRKMESIFADII